MDSHPVTIPDSAHRLHQAKGSPRQAVRPGHRSRATVLALIIIAVMAAVVGSLTWAYFSDTATTTATFSTGTVDLLICDGEGEEDCYPSLNLDPLMDIYPGWSYTTSGLQLYNQGTLTMTVSITATETITSPLAQVIGVQIYRVPPPTGTPIFSGTFQTLNTTGPYTYGPLAAGTRDDITFLFDWPDTGEDQTGLADQSLSEEITFYGTTEDVIQP